MLGNNKGEVNHIRRIVLACERDMEAGVHGAVCSHCLPPFFPAACCQDFTAAMDAVNVDLDEMRARVDATHSIITSRQRVEARFQESSAVQGRLQGKIALDLTVFYSLRRRPR